MRQEAIHECASAPIVKRACEHHLPGTGATHDEIVDFQEPNRTGKMIVSCGNDDLFYALRTEFTHHRVQIQHSPAFPPRDIPGYHA